MAVFAQYEETPSEVDTVTLTVPAGRTWIIHAMHLRPMGVEGGGMFVGYYVPTTESPYDRTPIYERDFAGSLLIDNSLWLHAGAGQEEDAFPPGISAAPLPRIPLPHGSQIVVQTNTSGSGKFLFVIED